MLDNEFKEFLNNDTSTPPESLTSNVLKYVSNNMATPPKIAVPKFLAIQLFVGIVTLLICPQFGFSFFGKENILHFLSTNFGENVCMFVCGIIFVGSGAIASSLYLNVNILKTVKKYDFAISASYALIIILFSLALGSSNSLMEYIFWMIGAVVFSVTVIRSIAGIKLQINNTSHA